MARKGAIATANALMGVATGKEFGKGAELQRTFKCDSSSRGKSREAPMAYRNQCVVVACGDERAAFHIRRCLKRLRRTK